MLLAVVYTSIALGHVDSSGTQSRNHGYYIDAEQRRIDLLDGRPDGQLTLSDSTTSLHAQEIYFRFTDSLQQTIDKIILNDATRKIYIEAVAKALRIINGRNVLAVKRHEHTLRFIMGELHARQQNKLLDYLSGNTATALSMVELFRDEPCADTFLIYASRFQPEVVLANYPLFSSRRYSLRVLEEVAKIAPVTIKRYFNPNENIYTALLRSNDTVVKTVLSIKEKLSRKTNAFALLHDIVYNGLTLEKADAIGNQSEKYLLALLNIRATKSPLGEYSVDKELEIAALKFVRVINDLHNEKDEVRFASVEKFSAQELYTLIVYSEEEIFTSTFNGLFKRMMNKIGNTSGFAFLGTVGNNRFRTFIKMAAGFGKLPDFLRSMTKVHQQMLMIKFASGLEIYPDLSQAVEVADAFASISDSLVLRILKATITYEYARLVSAAHYRGEVIYGLLTGMFANHQARGNSMLNDNTLKKFNSTPLSSLLDDKGVNRWLIYFYDDEDGDASFATFTRTFSDKNWSIGDSGSYVLIQSKNGIPVHIYANKPKHEYDGQEKLEKTFSLSGFEPQLMVHRGHSYYAFKTIEKIKDHTEIFVLGSCGGYHSIASIIDRSADISIVSSKQIGTMAVNNPMLKIIADDIRTGKDIEWASVWSRLQPLVKDNAKAYERFLDYIPPHKNLGAIFIKTYNSITAGE